MWAVFNDEGCLESQCSKDDAVAKAAQLVDEGDQHAYAAEECHDHEGQPAQHCEECESDDDDDDDERAE